MQTYSIGVKAFKKCSDGNIARGPAKERRTQVTRVSQADVVPLTEKNNLRIDVRLCR
jgi:hypothetical protein